MATVTLANSRDDSEAVEAVRSHHAQLAGTLLMLTGAVVTAAAERDDAAAKTARTDLLAWLRSDLLPHASAEERTMYPAARENERTRMLVGAMLDEHAQLGNLVAQLEAADEPVRAAATATAIRVVFDMHLDKENEYLLPVLAESAEVSLTDVLAGMHELLGGDADDSHPGHDQEGHDTPAAKGHAHDCGCAEVDEAGYPELDARLVPHAIRHATVFGALDAVAPGQGLVLVAPHDPLPLLAQIEQLHPGVFSVEYLQRGPEAWRLQLVRST